MDDAGLAMLNDARRAIAERDSALCRLHRVERDLAVERARSARLVEFVRGIVERPVNLGMDRERAEQAMMRYLEAK